MLNTYGDMLELSSTRLVLLQILMAITLNVASTHGMARAIKLYSIGKCKLKSQPHKIGPRIAPLKPYQCQYYELGKDKTAPYKPVIKFALR